MIRFVVKFLPVYRYPAMGSLSNQAPLILCHHFKLIHMKTKTKFIINVSLTLLGVIGLIFLPKLTLPILLGVVGTIAYQKFVK